MIKGIGIDIVELDRIAIAIDKNGIFLHRILTEKEMEIYNDISSSKRKIEFVAGRFAVKEAYAKAVGTGIGKLSFKDIEVLPNEQGAPVVNRKDDFKIFVSISHSNAYAVAQVVLEDV